MVCARLLSLQHAQGDVDSALKGGVVQLSRPCHSQHIESTMNDKEWALHLADDVPQSEEAGRFDGLGHRVDTHHPLDLSRRHVRLITILPVLPEIPDRSV